MSSYVPAICAGMVMAIVLLLAISCSKKNDKPVAKVNPPSLPADTSPQSTTAAAVTPEPPKKIKKHRPTTATYVNSIYGVSFSYPRKYSLKASKALSLLPGEGAYTKPGSVEIAHLEVPSDAYPDTDFSAGLLAVRVNPTVGAKECQEFGSEASDAAKPSAVKLGGNEFTELEQISGKAQGESDLKYFHLFKNQACYEFALDVETSRTADEDLAQVDRGKVFQQLEKILTSARIRSLDLPGTENAEKDAVPEINQAQPTKEKAQVVGVDQK